MSNRTRLVSTLVAAAALLFTSLPLLARADGFSTTNIQALQGWNFNDKKYGYNTPDGAMTTLTLNHFSTWEYGDNFFFVDTYLGQFRDAFGKPAFGAVGGATGTGATIYGEWHPRLFVNKLLHQQGNTLGIFRNWGLASEVNAGPSFYAYLAGLGFEFALPHPYVVNVNFYYRYDRFDTHEWQVSPSWVIPIALGPVPFLFTGFIDVAGTKDASGNQAIDVLAEPEFLVDVLAPFGGKANRLYAGVEWYYHAVPSGFWGRSFATSSPQLMVQWTFN